MTRNDFETLLTFKANGTLDGDELAQLDAALTEDADLRADLAALEAIRETMQAEEVASPGEFGLARLMRDVEAEGPRFAPEPAAANDNVVPLSRLRIWQVAAAVILAVGVAFNIPQLSGPSSMEADPAGFSLASGEEAATVDFTVTFAPDATEAEIRALLLEVDAEIVSGPSALGFYGVALLGSSADDDARAALVASTIVEDVQ